jgi:ABC-type branched-subunit amino acid transport system ATPase component
MGAVSHAPLHRLARQGLAFVPGERSVVSRLTTAQNLALGRDCDTKAALALFPPLGGLLGRRGGLLSGGEQQMLTLARALARPTRLLLADELSLGLAPRTVGALLAAVRAAADRGMGALVVEQHVHRVLQIADRVYVLRQGRVVFTGSAAEARSQMKEIQDLYLSPGEGPGAPSPAPGVPREARAALSEGK